MLLVTSTRTYTTHNRILLQNPAYTNATFEGSVTGYRDIRRKPFSNAFQFWHESRMLQKFDLFKFHHEKQLFYLRFSNCRIAFNTLSFCASYSPSLFMFVSRTPSGTLSAYPGAAICNIDGNHHGHPCTMARQLQARCYQNFEIFKPDTIILRFVHPANGEAEMHSITIDKRVALASLQWANVDMTKKRGSPPTQLTHPSPSA